MNLDDVINELLLRDKRNKGDNKKDMRGKQALLLLNRFQKADLEEKVNLCFLSNIFIIGLITNDDALLSKAKKAT